MQCFRDPLKSVFFDRIDQRIGNAGVFMLASKLLGQTAPAPVDGRGVRSRA